jgi:hypothetical protein
MWRLTLLDIKVEKDRPTSWQSIEAVVLGVTRRKMNLTGMGTSRALGMMMPSANLTKAVKGSVIKSRAPTNVIAPSVSSGTLIMIECFLDCSLWRSPA